MKEDLYKQFGSQGHKGFLNEASFIDKTDRKDP